MNAKQFLAEFSHIANAPGGVQRLREMIYNLAVTGNLTCQIENEGNASTLLEKIKVEKSSRIKAKKFKRTPKFEKLECKIPTNIKLPPHWVWTNLVSIGEISPKNQADDDLDASFIPMTGVSQLHSGALLDENRKWGNIKKGYTQFKNGDVVIAKITPCFENGKSAVIDNLINGIGSGTTELHVVRPLPGVNARYIYIFLRSPFFMVEGELSMTGTAGQKRLTSEYFSSRALPLPPEGEQARIVAKVDELMMLCDSLTSQQQKKRELQNQLRKATIQAVYDASSQFEFQQQWRRLQNNLIDLFSFSDDIKDLKQLIMSLAIRGLLVKQEEKETNDVEKVLRGVLLKKDLLIKDGLIKRPKPTYKVQKDEEPFVIPESWKFVRFSEVTICLDGKRIPLSKSERQYRSGAYPYYGASGVIDSIDDYIFDKELLLIGEDGANLVNRSTPIAFIASGKYWVNNHAHVLDTLNAELLNYLALYINAIDLKPYVTGTAQPKMNQSKMNEIVVALPPLHEIKKILRSVNELESICDLLAKRLHQATITSKNLAISSIATLTGISLTNKEESLKIPTTQLLAPVVLGNNVPNSKDEAPLAKLLARHNGQINATDLWQRFGGGIDTFYAQLKTEVAHGWIAEPVKAEMLEKDQ